MVFKLHRLNQNLHRRPKSGRRPKTNDRQQRQLVRLVKIDPNKTASDVLGVQISYSTAQRILRRHKLNASRPVRKPLLKKCHRMARLHFARVHRHWTVADWRRVIWSDECKFNLYNSDGAIYIRRPPGKRIDPKYCKGTMKFGGGGGIMTWGKGKPSVPYKIQI